MSVSIVEETKQTADFISAIFAPDDLICFRYIETWTETTNGKEHNASKVKHREWIRCDSFVSNAELHVSLADVHNANHFFGVCPRVATKNYDLACQIRTVRCLWSDIDHCTPDEARQRIADVKLPEPSIVNGSGNGTHVYWLLSDPYIIDDAIYNGPIVQDFDEWKRTKKTLFRDATGAIVKPSKMLSPKADKMQRIVAGIAEKIGGDSTQDVSRLLRLPGTLNRKNVRNGATTKPCVMVTCDTSRRYSLDTFEPFEQPAKAVKPAPVKPPAKLPSGHVEQFNALLAECATAQDRSKADYALCCHAARIGMDGDDVWERVQDVGKFEEAGEDYFRRTWDRASSSAHDEQMSRGDDVATMLGVSVDTLMATTAAPAPRTEATLATAAAEMPKPEAKDRTDLGNAMMFVHLYGSDLRWVKQWKKWIRWTGHYWQPVESETVAADYVHPMVRYVMPDRVKTIDDADDRKAWLGWMMASNQAHKIRAILELAQSKLMVPVESLNTDPYLFATQNAVLDLRTCERVEPKREHFITTITPVTFDPAADCPTFKRFISEILIDEKGQPCPDVVWFVQRLLGYCLTPSVAEQAFYILHGKTGQNGKTTLMETIMAVMGGYAMAGNDTLYFESRDKSNSEDVARLYGKRLCVTSETNQSSYFTEAKIKKLTGEETITASRKFEHEFDFKPTHKLFLVCNDRPKFNTDDTAIIRRVKLIPFLYHVPPEKRDNTLAGKLRAESSGIFNWMLIGLKAWNRGETLGDANTPAIMRAQKEGYIAENDDLASFFDECLVADPTGTIGKDELYRRYDEWAKDGGRRYVMTKRTLGQKLTARKWEERNGTFGRVWVGWKPKPTKAERVEAIVRAPDVPPSMKLAIVPDDEWDAQMGALKVPA